VRFLSKFVHELRTSLTIITLISRYLVPPEGTAQGQTMFKEFQEELGHLHELLNTASFLAQVDIGLHQYEPVNLAQVARQEIALLSALAKKKHQELRSTGPKQLVVQGDEEQLRWMIRQLVHNAIQHTSEGGQISCEWTDLQQTSLKSDWPGSAPLPRDQKGWAALRVIDTGVGISQEELPYIFDRFYRGKAPTPMTGTGLGLAIVREVVALHQGHIEVDSTPGEGSCFVVYLPLAL
jgi:two-component system OmpR family sensor kinase